MPLRKKTIMQGVFDRIATQAQSIRDGLDGATTSGVPAVPFYLRTHDGLCDDPTDHPNGDAIFENALVGPADNLDKNFQSGTTLSTIYGSFIGSLNTYLSRVGRTGGIDQWLQDMDLNVHLDFNPVFRSINGANLDAINVFLNDPIELARVSTSSSGVGTVTLGTPLGTGTGKFSDESGSLNSAGAQLEAYVASGSGFGSDLDLNFTLKRENTTNETNVLVTVLSSASVGDTFDVGIATDKHIEVVSLMFAGGDTGMVVGIRQKIERTISL